ncbi:ricin B-like lectin [Dichomitus squalens]|uniref:Ricin B-like lectin n=1 Tax=Dichomitus squalens TaxID=114155 RepID=A0A4Q9PP18_9APHY|nr:ricin B-like lectin [Dichomitus squalens]
MAAETINDGVYFIQNLGKGTVLDLESGSSKNNTKVKGHKKREINDPWVSAQLWLIARVPGTVKYTIQNANSRTFLDLKGGVAESETPLVGYEATNKVTQHWMIQRNSNGTAYVIFNAKSTSASTPLFIDLYAGGVVDGTPIKGIVGEGSVTPNTNQLWIITRA